MTEQKLLELAITDLRAALAEDAPTQINLAERIPAKGTSLEANALEFFDRVYVEPASQESRQVEPVVEFRGRRNTPEKTSECWGILLCDFMQDPPKGTKLYAAPPKRKPLTDAEIGAVAADIWGSILIAPQSYQQFARAIERAHGIGGEK